MVDIRRYITNSSRLTLIILAVSVLTIPIQRTAAVSTDTAITTAVKPLASKINNKVGVDKFGITEIYPTKPDGGREWYINMKSPLNDNNFFLSGGTEKTNSSFANATSSNGQIKKQTDDSYQVYGVRKPGKYDFSVRMNINTSDSEQWWKNVEMTGYDRIFYKLSRPLLMMLPWTGMQEAVYILAPILVKV
ncbi:MAG: hypothetical protein WA364_12285 [Candidatus Nitrosopolaris sp.]